jgi:hypothetical protein
MASQWQNFLRNLGEWRGSFTTIATDGTLRESTPSVLTLESDDDGQLVRFGLRRWPAGMTIAPGGGPGEGAGEPSRAMVQDYRNLGRQVVFFDSGAFNKGSLQVAPVRPDEAPDPPIRPGASNWAAPACVPGGCCRPPSRADSATVTPLHERPLPPVKTGIDGTASLAGIA